MDDLKQKYLSQIAAAADEDGLEAIRRVAVLGAGAFGTALAIHCAALGHRTRVWAYDRGLPDAVAAAGENDAYLPGFAIDPGVRFTNDMAEADALCDRLVIIDHGQAIALDTPENLKALGYEEHHRDHTGAVEFLDAKPDGPFFLAVGFMETHRAAPPNMEDFFGRVDFFSEIPNTDLKPEESLSWELGLKYQGGDTSGEVYYYRTDYKELIERVYIAGLLHDVGKVRISPTILKKNGPLDDEDQELLERVEAGFDRIVERIRKDAPAVAALAFPRAPALAAVQQARLAGGGHVEPHEHVGPGAPDARRRGGVDEAPAGVEVVLPAPVAQARRDPDPVEQKAAEVEAEAVFPVPEQRPVREIRPARSQRRDPVGGRIQ